MQSPRPPRPARTLATAALVAVCAAVAARAADVTVSLDLIDGSTRRGLLDRIDADSVALRAPADGGADTVPVATVRRLSCAADPAVPRRVVVALADGGGLEVDDFTWQGDTATVTREGARGTLPIGLVRQVAWREAGAAATPEWLAALPERLESDLVVVGTGEGFECVACAIEKVAADTVTVVLDGETIPVRREKIRGLVWLREPVAARGAKVTAAGGTLRAGRVEWSAGGLVLDGAVRLPAEWLAGIDYAAGRTTRLADLAAERSDVEPGLGDLAAHPALATFFGPRTLRPDDADGPADILLRPRTVSVWRVPAGSRRFRADLAAAAWGTPESRSTVAVALDGREVARTEVGAGAPAAPALDLDVSAARRLTLSIDFVAEGDVGCPVRLGDPVFEQ
jgi:hypothetical protein